MQEYQHFPNESTVFPISVESSVTSKNLGSFPNLARRNPLMNGLPLPLAVRLGYSVSLKNKGEHKNNEAREKSIRKVSYGQLVEGRYMIVIHRSIAVLKVKSRARKWGRCIYIYRWLTEFARMACDVEFGISFLKEIPSIKMEDVLKKWERLFIAGTIETWTHTHTFLFWSL